MKLTARERKRIVAVLNSARSRARWFARFTMGVNRKSYINRESYVQAIELQRELSELWNVLVPELEREHRLSKP